MKKVVRRWLFLMLMLLICSMAACDVDSRDREEQEEDSEEQKDAEEGKDAEGKDIIAVDDILPSVESTYVPHPAGGNSYKRYLDGCWYFYADATGEEDTHGYAYDVEKKIVTQVAGIIPGDTDETAWKNYKISDVTLAAIDVEELIYAEVGTTLIDWTTGETIVTLNENQWFFRENVRGGYIKDGLAQVIEVTESPTGNIYAMGVMNMQGEWVCPLSTDYPWLGEGVLLKNKCYEYIHNGAWWWSSWELSDEDGQLHEVHYIFDAVNNKVLEWPKQWQSQEFDELLEYIHNSYYYYQDKLVRVKAGSFLEAYDFATGTIVDLEETYAFEFYIRKDDEQYIGAKGDNPVMVSSEGILKELDLSGYDANFSTTMNENGVVATIRDDSGAKYFCLFKWDGSLAFDPIKEDELPGGYSYLTDKKLVKADEHACWIYNLDTQEITSRMDLPYTIEEYYEEVDMLLVEAEHEVYGAGFYLVDTDDLDTLINPFE